MIKEAIQTAVRMETDAMKFYREAASKASHPFGKKLFEGFIKDEARHLKMLDDILKGLDLTFVPMHPKDQIKTVFSELKDQMMSRVKASDDEYSAVSVALDFEKAGYEFYKKSLAGATTEAERKLFERLAQEEEEHYKILQNTLSFIKDTGDWFMWNEGGIIEG